MSPTHEQFRTTEERATLDRLTALEARVAELSRSLTNAHLGVSRCSNRLDIVLEALEARVAKLEAKVPEYLPSEGLRE